MLKCLGHKRTSVWTHKAILPQSEITGEKVPRCPQQGDSRASGPNLGERKGECAMARHHVFSKGIRLLCALALLLSLVASLMYAPKAPVARADTTTLFSDSFTDADGT